MRQYALVELTEESKEQWMLARHFYIERLAFIFLGEITNMPGHFVVSGQVTAKFLSGHSIDSWQQIRSEVTKK